MTGLALDPRPRLALASTLLLLAAVACADDTPAEGSTSQASSDSDSVGDSSGSSDEIGETDSTSADTTDTDTTADTSTDTTTESSTDADTTADTSSEESTGDTTDTETDEGMLCTPGETQCVDADTYETCDEAGEAWGDPVDCLPTEECLGGECVSLCSVAEANKSSVGCVYYAIDADNHNGYDSLQFSVVVSNVDDQVEANVDVLSWSGADWTVEQSQVVSPGSLYQFDLPDQHIDLSGVHSRGAYKVVSDVPIIAYQFQPVDGVNSFTSDASLLLPVSALDQFYYVVGWGENSFLQPEIQIVATADDTAVEITPSTTTTAGGGLQAYSAGQAYMLPPMQEGDVIQLNGNSGFTGTYITADKPISVFSSHNCANVPSLNAACCCDHIEEQTYGLQTWGTAYVASRFPARNGGNPEPSYWHVFAAEDGTNVTVEANAEVTGIGNQNFVLNAGELTQLAVDGSVAHPGDFFVSADKPISVVQYMSSQDAGNAGTGDPAMALAVPVEQFRPNYVVLVPPNWVNDFLVITKPSNISVTLDGVEVDQGAFTAVGPAGDPTNWEVARVAVADGVHTLEGGGNFSVTVVGYDQYDSYAYPGGLNQQIINPQ